MTDFDNLFVQMNPKRNNNQILNEDKKKDNNTICERLDYYAILGIKKDATQNEVKKAYQKKLKKFHPDKIEPTKENKLKYKMIREAGDILSNIHKRKAYDIQKKTDNNTQDFISQKQSYKEFIQLQEQNMTDEDRKIAKLNFDRSIQEIIQEHKLDTDTKLLTQDEYTRKIDDLLLQREQESFDIHEDNIFEGRQFNSNEFNNIFEKHKTKISNNVADNTGLVLFKDGIGVYNNDNVGTSIDNIGSLYATGTYTDYNENYAGIDNTIDRQDTNNDIENDDISIDSPDEFELNDQSNKIDVKLTDENIDDKIKDILLERDTQDSKFNNMSHNEFGSAIDDDYGISKQFGFMIGNDRYGHQKTTNNKLTKSNIKIYKELTQS